MNNLQNVEIEVAGMTCGSCVRRVHAALSSLHGVKAIAVSQQEAKVRVQYDRTLLHLQNLLDALDDAGYEPRAIAA